MWPPSGTPRQAPPAQPTQPAGEAYGRSHGGMPSDLRQTAYEQAERRLPGAWGGGTGAPQNATSSYDANGMNESTRTAAKLGMHAGPGSMFPVVPRHEPQGRHTGATFDRPFGPGTAPEAASAPVAAPGGRPMGSDYRPRPGEILITPDRNRAMTSPNGLGPANSRGTAGNPLGAYEAQANAQREEYRRSMMSRGSSQFGSPTDSAGPGAAHGGNRLPPSAQHYQPNYYQPADPTRTAGGIDSGATAASPQRSDAGIYNPF